MRLICPNCDAQYEIADNVIPQEGRDVQCSNCGSTWFQEAPDPSEVAEAPQAPEAEDELAAADSVSDEAGDAVDEGTASDTDDDEAMVPQSTVSDESAAILREEAMRELKARLAESGGLEQQGDLGLADAGGAERAVEPVPVPVPVPAPSDGRGVSRDRDTAEAVARTVGSSRGRLPDIEEVNTSLGPRSLGSDKKTGAQAKATKQARSGRGGFRFGFLLVLILTGLGVGAYAYEPMISDRVPDAAPILGDYVQWVDDLRIWFDGFTSDTIRGLQLMYEDMTGG